MLTKPTLNKPSLVLKGRVRRQGREERGRRREGEAGGVCGGGGGGVHPSLEKVKEGKK